MVIFQKPNKYAFITLLALTSTLFLEGILRNFSFFVGILFGSIWSYYEVTTGINWFRKGLGVIGFILLLYLLHQYMLSLF